jgi:hypothetical protein
MKVRHPGRVGVPTWWRLAAWPYTALGLLMVTGGAAIAVVHNMLGLQIALAGLLLLEMIWANAIALGTTRPGWVTVRGALARQAARRFRYLAGFLGLLAVAAAVGALLVARDARLAADPPPGGRGMAVAWSLLASISYLGLAWVVWLRARLIDSWA